MDFHDLYERAYGGDDSAEEQLFGLLSVMFQMFVRRRGVGTEDTEDIVQNALAKIARFYRQGERKDNFAAWAQTVVKNEHINFHRGQSSLRKRHEALAARTAIFPGSQPDPDLKARLMSCLRKLHRAHPLHARVLNLHYQGYSTAEVCARLGVTANHRRVALCRARAMLRACLDEPEGEE